MLEVLVLILINTGRRCSLDVIIGSRRKKLREIVKSPQWTCCYSANTSLNLENLPGLFSFCLWSSDMCLFYYFIKCLIKIFGEHLDVKGRQTAKWWRSSIISEEDWRLHSPLPSISSLITSFDSISPDSQHLLSSLCLSPPLYLYRYLFYI